MSNWDWQVFCKSTLEGEVVAGCFGSKGDITYLDWLLSAWGWTLSVALLALLVALLVGSLIGILRTLPHKGWAFFGNAWRKPRRTSRTTAKISSRKKNPRKKSSTATTETLSSLTTKASL